MGELVGQIVRLLILLEALQRREGDLEHVRGLQHEEKALVEIHGGQLGGRGLE